MLDNWLSIPAGLKVVRQKFPEPEISVSRDKAVQMAISIGARWLWFVDADVLPPPNALTVLLEANKPIIGGLYVRRHNPPFNEMLRFRTDGTQGLRPIADGEYEQGTIVEADAVATGCLLINTEVFDKMKPYEITIDGQPSRPAWFLWTEWRLPVGLCVLPNQNVLGGSLIQNVKAGEQVVSGGGNLASVERPFTRTWEGDIISMRGVAMGLRAKVTPEHQLLIKRSVDSPSEWVEAKDLVIGNFASFPIPQKPITKETFPRWTRRMYLNGPEFKASYKRRGIKLRKAKRYIPNYYYLNKELGELLGFFVAEGSVTRDRIQFSFGKGPTETLRGHRVARLMEEIFRVKCQCYRINSTFRVCGKNKTLAHFLRLWFGVGARNKCLPKWIYQASLPFTKGFLSGFWRGDGYMTYSGAYKSPLFGTNIASKELALGIVSLLLKLGIRPQLREYRQHGNSFSHNLVYTVRIQEDYNKLALILHKPHRPRHHNYGRSSTFISEGKYWFPLKSVIRELYSGPVYDLQGVSPDNSYVLENFVVHNSEDFSFCVRARKQGIGVYCHTAVKCDHQGPIKFTPSGNNTLSFKFPGTF